MELPRGVIYITARGLTYHIWHPKGLHQPVKGGQVGAW